MMVKAIAGLLVACLVLSFGLYKSVQANGAYRHSLDIAEQVNENQHQQFIKMQERAKEYALIAEKNLKEKQRLERQGTKVKHVIREVKVNADPKDCLNQPVHPDIECLFTENCPETG